MSCSEQITALDVKDRAVGDWTACQACHINKVSTTDVRGIGMEARLVKRKM